MQRLDSHIIFNKLLIQNIINIVYLYIITTFM